MKSSTLYEGFKEKFNNFTGVWPGRESGIPPLEYSGSIFSFSTGYAIILIFSLKIPDFGKDDMTVKKIIAIALALCLLALCGCGANSQAETTVPTTEVPTTAAPTTEAPTTVPPTEEPTEPPTEAPTEPPVPTNPLTGETLEETMETRFFAVTINNVQGAMPMYGVSKADLFFEMFINDYATRGLALYADIREVSSVGSVRSLRFNFTDLAQIYDAVVVHASGSKYVLSDADEAGIDRLSAESEKANYFYRDQSRISAGYAWEHTLFIRGQETMDHAESKGIRVTRDLERDFGLRFAEDGTPTDGEDASVIDIRLIHKGVPKKTKMTYDPDTGLYQFNQFNRDMWDNSENQPVCFKNVIVMFCTVENQVYGKTTYHVADLIGSGDGWFACGGKIIPIKWTHENMEDPIVFTHTDGTPLELGVGNSYIAFAPLESTVEYK